MTEGPEATHIAQYVQKFFANKRLLNITIRSGRYKTHGPPQGFPAFKRNLPLTLLGVEKKGKVLFFFFEKQYTLIAKMGMTGWFSGKSEVPLHESKPALEFVFEHETLVYTDFRNFGTLFFTNSYIDVLYERGRIAPDILDPSLTFSSLTKRFDNIALKFPTLRLEEALMDQRLLFSGIGNILKSEILYDAHLSPRRTLRSLAPKDWKTLFTSAKKLSEKVLEILNSGTHEEYFSFQKVYQKEKDPEGNRVSSYKTNAGRSTFWVPAIQK